ncbi:hypothetical protein HYH02_001955 [Chlamydomonas schloesseri]|uniref:Metallo-beta-lactamase domain-containing protein n=1 Tax=Chlamydomonas schloesseri TaxID=2026947 RepID=A0A836BCF4_9CHLO|nr:hypothetical protein HYH02_001955 [Chlamydomonas schloesseri]|eukprot:KAG2453744.1 hypothetical protein HYH02_001955 [Chlamydomonas schloesseri]
MATQVESIKWVPGTNFIVDGFAFTSPKCKHYFLTHAHSDHTIGLRKSFNAGLIHCSHVTARLLIHDMGVRPEVVRPLEVGVPVVVAGVRVTPLDANHCPGSVMFLFEVPIRDRDRAGGSGPGAGSGAGQQQAAGSVGVKAEEATGLKIEAAVGLEAAVLVKPELGEVGVGEEEEAAGSLAAELGMAEAAVAGQHLQEAQGACSCQGGGGDASREDGGDEEDDEAARGVELEAGCQQLMALAAADAGAAGAAAGGTQQGWGMAVGTPEGLPGSEALLRGARAAAAGPQATGGEGAGCPSGWGTIGAGASGSGECTGAWCGGVATHNVLHTGDMRWQRWMRDQPGLAGVRVDTLFLDTTYALPRHRLPPQEEAIAMMVQAMREAQAEEAATLFVVAAYHIGKERAFLGAAQQLGTKVWATPDKRKVLALLGLAPEQAGLLVERPEEADIHVGGWGLRHEDLQSAAKLWSPPGGRSNQPGPRQQPQKGYCWYNNAGPSGLTNH